MEHPDKPKKMIRDLLVEPFSKEVLKSCHVTARGNSSGSKGIRDNVLSAMLAFANRNVGKDKRLTDAEFIKTVNNKLCSWRDEKPSGPSGPSSQKLCQVETDSSPPSPSGEPLPMVTGSATPPSAEPLLTAKTGYATPPSAEPLLTAKTGCATPPSAEPLPKPNVSFLHRPGRTPVKIPDNPPEHELSRSAKKPSLLKYSPRIYRVRGTPPKQPVISASPAKSTSHCLPSHTSPYPAALTPQQAPNNTYHANPYPYHSYHNYEQPNYHPGAWNSPTFQYPPPPQNWQHHNPSQSWQYPAPSQSWNYPIPPSDPIHPPINTAPPSHTPHQSTSTQSTSDGTLTLL